MRRGTTLVEALIGLMLVACGLGAALALATDTARTTHATEAHVLAKLALLDALIDLRDDTGTGVARRVEPAGTGLARVVTTTTLHDGTTVTLARVVRAESEEKREP